MSEKVFTTADLEVVWTTVDTESAGRKLAGSVLDRGLAACVQIDSAMESHYVWEGQRRVDTEYRLVFKTTVQRSVELVDFLSRHHPYDEPQILVMPVTRATPGYAAWVARQTGSPPAD